MRAVVQRVDEARVVVGERVVGSIEHGVVILLGIAPEDGASEARWLADKVANLRIFNDEEGKMNRSLLSVTGSALVVSQFTLYGDARRGRRPSFLRAAQGPEAEEVYREVIAALRALDIHTETGEFGTTMSVALVNDGPTTILLDSDKQF